MAPVLASVRKQTASSSPMKRSSLRHRGRDRRDRRPRGVLGSRRPDPPDRGGLHSTPRRPNLERAWLPGEDDIALAIRQLVQIVDKAPEKFSSPTPRAITSVGSRWYPPRSPAPLHRSRSGPPGNRACIRAPENLDGLRCGRGRQTTCLELCHRGLLEEGLLAVSEPCRAIGQPSCRLKFRRNIRQLELDRLELRDGVAELIAFAGHSPGHVEDRLGQAQRQRRDRDPTDFEGPEELPETHVRITDQVDRPRSRRRRSTALGCRGPPADPRILAPW